MNRFWNKFANLLVSALASRVLFRLSVSPHSQQASSLSLCVASPDPLAHHTWCVERHDMFRNTSPFGRPQRQEPRPWTTSSSSYGAFSNTQTSQHSFRRPALHFEPPIGGERITSEEFGAFLSPKFKPMSRPRPVSNTTILMRNSAISDGLTSAEALGRFTGVSPNHNLISGRRPATPPLFERLHDVSCRESDIIGTHPTVPPIDAKETARIHTEANFARRFPSHLSSRSTQAESAIKHQDNILTRARHLASQRLQVAPDSAVVDKDSPSKQRSDKVSIPRGMKSQSAMIGGCVPNIDMRTKVTRPASLPYGSANTGQPSHLINTPRGLRQVLPSRSFMPISMGSPIESRHRVFDF